MRNNMKSLLSWFLLVVSIAVLVSSCAKSDDSKTVSVKDGLPKFKDMPEEFGGSGATMPE